jgi:glutathione S-transferase
MFAPVVMRFQTYLVELDGEEAAYQEAMLAHPAIVEWVQAAEAEPWTIEMYEVG